MSGLRRALIGSVAVALLAASACSNFQYRNDHRVEITSPKNRGTVTLPVDVRWTYKDFDATGPSGSRDKKHGYFAVFVDRSPMPAGQDLRWIGKGDRACVKTPGCPDVRYLTDHNVFTTTTPEVKLAALPAPSVHTKKEHHEITVVLLDGTVHRIGESAWYVFVTYNRKQAL